MLEFLAGPMTKGYCTVVPWMDNTVHIPYKKTVYMPKTRLRYM